MNEQEQLKIGKALIKVALGFQVAEVTEEFAEVDGELKLTKRKKTKKDVPPDLRAMQLLLSENGGENDFTKMSDDELQAERKRLLLALQADGESEKDKGQVLIERKTVAKNAGATKPKAKTKPKTKTVRKK